MNEMKHIIALAEAQNWTVERGGSHYKFYPPSGSGFVTAPMTPSDWRSYRNTLGELSRLGLQKPRKHPKKKRHQTRSLQIAATTAVPYRDIDAMPPYRHLEQIIGQWRTEDWFDEGGLPLAEDEWDGPDDPSLLAGVLLEALGAPSGEPNSVTFLHKDVADRQRIFDHRGDRALRIHFYALKYWGGCRELESGVPDEACDCICGYHTDQGSLALADHIVPILEAGLETIEQHAPEGLLQWFDPAEIEESFRPALLGDMEDEVSQLRQQAIRWKGAHDSVLLDMKTIATAIKDYL